MIKLESAHIEEVRGIRNLDIEPAGKTLSISGPNGSGKSGVIDGIEFGLTGQIGRLMGRGTKGLTVAEHGPHIDKTRFPDAPFVVLKVSLPALKKTATITRKVSAPKKPKIEPSDPDVLAALAEIAEHPEITLSRREILRFILIEPTKRSEEIQTILKLEEVGNTRSALNPAHWQDQERGSILPWWWALFLASGFVANASARVSLLARRLPDFILANILDIVSNALDIASAGVALALVIQIFRMQIANRLAPVLPRL